MTEVEIYNKILEFFERKIQGTYITEEEKQKYFIPEIELKIDLKRFEIQSFYCRLASSLQNSGNMQNSIKFNNQDSENYRIIKNTLFDFDARRVLKEYDNENDLYKALTDNGITDKGVNITKGSNWKKYAKGLYKGANFLVNKKGEEIINNLISYNNAEEVKDEYIDKIKYISTEIYGLGFALTCDWLKECGCTWLAKPDVHINAVYNVIHGKKEKASVKEEEVVKYMFNWAKSLKSVDPEITPYKLDKIIWLICTGNFYLHPHKLINRNTIVNMINNKN